MKEPPGGVRNCWGGGPGYHCHWEWVVIFLLGFVVPALLVSRLFGHSTGSGVLFLITMFVWLLGSYHLATRHLDPDSIWVHSGGD